MSRARPEPVDAGSAVRDVLATVRSASLRWQDLIVAWEAAQQRDAIPAIHRNAGVLAKFRVLEDELRAVINACSYESTGPEAAVGALS